ncbi:MAG: aspartate aminotransferase [candidate division Zixibacteria bacterium SM23_81]|nr:MAG: aspartate aminotransferase [candidate division Zixibacteria bacterium SM23_81]
MKLANRMGKLGTETAFVVLAKAKALEAQGKDVIHLEIGEPDFDTPKNIREAAKRALDEGYTHYGPSAGFPAFREVIAQEISKRWGVSVTPEQVVVTPGAKPIMFFAILALINSGDEVIYPNPGFPIYESVINLVGANPVPILLREENDFEMDIQELRDKITSKTRMLIINSPGNPTGSVLSKTNVEAIAEIIRGKEIMVLSDEVYHRILYEGEHHSIFSVPGMQEQTILLNGFSKTYAMTGWRLGFGVMREDLAQKIAQLMTNSNSCTSSFTQMAGIEALQGPQDEVDRMVAEFRRRRQVIVEGLNAIDGISCKKPKGAFYVFPNVKEIGWNCGKLADYFLEKAGVAVLSGLSFGQFGDGYLRLSYANSVENIQKSLERIRDAIAAI